MSTKRERIVRERERKKMRRKRKKWVVNTRHSESEGIGDGEPSRYWGTVGNRVSLVSVGGEYLGPESVCRKPDAFIGYAMEHLKALYPLGLSSWP